MQKYSTTDFYLTGFLVASNVSLIDHSRQDRTTTFTFEHTDQLDQLITEYYGMRATVNPFSYGTALKQLKGLIHSYTNIYSEDNSHVSQIKGNQ